MFRSSAQLFRNRLKQIQVAIETMRNGDKTEAYILSLHITNEAYYKYTNVFGEQMTKF